MGGTKREGKGGKREGEKEGKGKGGERKGRGEEGKGKGRTPTAFWTNQTLIISSCFPVFDGAKSFFAHFHKKMAVAANRRLLKDLPSMKVITLVHNVDCW